MYIWIWRHLPGGTATKSTLAILLFVAVCALFMFVIFPYVEPRLPFNNVTIDE